MIVNGLLCYAIHHMNSGAEYNIEHCLYKFYKHNEVIEAKKILWGACKDDLEAYEGRKRSEGRTATEAHIQDIMKALKKLDAINKTPEVYVKNLDNVPDRQPEDMNYAMLVQRVADLMKYKADTDDVLTKMNIDILNLQEAQRNNSKNTNNDQPLSAANVEPAAGQDNDQ